MHMCCYHFEYLPIQIIYKCFGTSYRMLLFYVTSIDSAYFLEELNFDQWTRCFPKDCFRYLFWLLYFAQYKP